MSTHTKTVSFAQQDESTPCILGLENNKAQSFLSRFLDPVNNESTVKQPLSESSASNLEPKARRLDLFKTHPDQSVISGFSEASEEDVPHSLEIDVDQSIISTFSTFSDVPAGEQNLLRFHEEPSLISAFSEVTEVAQNTSRVYHHEASMVSAFSEPTALVQNSSKFHQEASLASACSESTNVSLEFATDTTWLSCYKCNRQLQPWHDHVRLACPCWHTLCPECTISLVVNRKFADVTCKECSNVVSTITYCHGYESSTLPKQCSSTNRGPTRDIEIKKHSLNLYKEPFRCFEAEFNKDPYEAATKAVLSLSIVDRNTFQPVSFISTIDLEDGPESIEDELSLRTIFSLLHRPFVQNSVAVMPVTRMTEADLVDFAAYKENSILFKILYGLATGRVQVDSETFDKPNCWRSGRLSEALACFIAKETICRLHTRGPLILQKVLSIVLEKANAQKDLREFLSRLKLAESPQTRYYAKEKQTVRRKHAAVDNDPLSLVGLNFDQIGFKVRQGTYKNHLVMQIQLDPPQQLKLLGFYNDNRISRSDGITWEELRKIHGDDTRDLAKAIVGVRDNDIKTLSHYVLTNIKTVVSYLPQLPDVDACKLMVETNDFKSWSFRFANNLGVKLQESSTLRDEQEYTIRKGAVRRSAEESSKLTFYERNNIHLDVDHSDPSKIEAVEALLDYLNCATDTSDRSWNDDVAANERPLREDFVFVTCDNSPASIWWTLRNKDIQSNRHTPEERKYKRFRFVVGGYHAEAAFLCSRGRLSKDVVTPFIQRYRTTEARVNWVLQPHDTRDVKNENVEYILAHYAAAAAACQISLQKDDVSAAAVHEYMLARAEKYPAVMALLLDLRLITIDFMIRDSESAGDRGDVDLFLSSMRLALIFFACTNAHKYVRTVCEFLEWFHCASSAEKLIFKKYYFCKITANGRPIWGDRAVETTMLHIRKFMGRYARPEHDKTLDNTVTEIPFRQEGMRDLRDVLGADYSWFSKQPWNKQFRKLGKVYAHTRIACDDWNVWGEGPPKTCPEALGHEETDIVLPDGNSLSNTYLSAKLIGEKRVLDFYQMKLVDNRHPVSINNSGVSLKMLPTTRLKREQDLEALKIMRYGTREEDFLTNKMQNIMNKEKLVSDIQWYHQVFHDVPDDFYTPNGNLRSKYDRRKLVALLCKFRRRYYHENPQQLEAHQLEMEQFEWDDVTSTVSDRRDELKDPFYCLDQDVLNGFR